MACSAHDGSAGSAALPFNSLQQHAGQASGAGRVVATAAAGRAIAGKAADPQVERAQQATGVHAFVPSHREYRCLANGAVHQALGTLPPTLAPPSFLQVAWTDVNSTLGSTPGAASQAA